MSRDPDPTPGPSPVTVYQCPEHGILDGRAVRHESHSQIPFCILCERDVAAVQYVPADELERLQAERDRLREAVRYLAERHHNTIRNSKLHDPENREWSECDCKPCVVARTALAQTDTGGEQ